MQSAYPVLSKLREKKTTVTVIETAEILGISRTAAYLAVKAGDIPSIRIGRRRLIPLAALETLLNNAALSAPKPN